MPNALGGAVSGVVCDDRPAVRRALAALLSHTHFTLAAEVGDYVSLHEAVRRTTPTVALITFPLAGLNGLAAVRLLRDEVPQCQIVLISSYSQLAAEAAHAGAWALVSEEDPQRIVTVLRAIAAAPRCPTEVPLPRAQPPASSIALPAGTAGSVSTNPSS